MVMAVRWRKACDGAGHGLPVAWQWPVSGQAAAEAVGSGSSWARGQAKHCPIFGDPAPCRSASLLFLRDARPPQSGKFMPAGLVSVLALMEAALVLVKARSRRDMA